MAHGPPRPLPTRRSPEVGASLRYVPQRVQWVSSMFYRGSGVICETQALPAAVIPALRLALRAVSEVERRMRESTPLRDGPMHRGATRLTVTAPAIILDSGTP
jgi:Flp pilus assembly CpaF family ATPase